jgi:hypothetical protein
MDRRLWKKRWLRALLATYFLRYVPFVRFVGLNGSMVTGAMNKESDIDFFIVLQKGRIFSGRFFVTVAMHLLGLRRHGDKIAGRICLNRYSTQELLSIGPPTLYHARVFSNLIPLFSFPGLYRRYVEENRWMNAFGFPVKVHKPVLELSFFSRSVQKAAEWGVGAFLPRLELLLRSEQHRRFAKDGRVRLQGSRVVVSDVELCFHLAKEV